MPPVQDIEAQTGTPGGSTSTSFTGLENQNARVLTDGWTEDGRAEAPQPPVLGPGAVLVAYDGGPAGRAALAHAARVLPGVLGIVHTWQGEDPLVAARAGGRPGAGGELLRAIYATNERARARAEEVALAGVAIAQEAGRAAVPVVRRESDVVAREALLRSLAERFEASHLVLAAAGRPRWRRVLFGPGAPERLAADPPCPCTVVPAGAAEQGPAAPAA
jgi:nucleotide-binding universal stress UspA family protein